MMEFTKLKSYNDRLKFIKTYNGFIAKRNKSYSKLSKEKKVVALCEDSIYNLLSGLSYGNDSNGYVVTDHDVDLTKSLLEEINPKELKKIKKNTHYGRDAFKNISAQLLIPMGTCNVCAKGSMFLSAVSFKNELIIDKLNNAGTDCNYMLKEEFTKEEWDILESAYELLTVPKIYMRGDQKINFSDFHLTFGINYLIKYFDTPVKNFNSKYANRCLYKNGGYSLLSYISRNDSLVIHGTNKLLQLTANIITNKGNILKALSLKNNLQVNYKKIFSDVLKKYPDIINQKNTKNIIKEFNKNIRKSSLSFENLRKEIKKYHPKENINFK